MSRAARIDSLAGCAALAMIGLLAAASVARAEAAEAIALELEFAEGVSPCFTSAELASEVSQRLGQPVSTAVEGTPPPLSIHVRVAPADDTGFAVAIETRERDTGATGQRDLRVGGDCAALAQPLSLVVALMVGAAASEPTPPAAAAEPIAAPPPAPPPPVAAPERTERPAAPITAVPPARQAPTYTGVALKASGGADLGMNGETSALASIAVQFALLNARSDGRARLTGEVAAEFVPSPGVESSGRQLAVAATGLQSSLCGAFYAGPFTLEPCAGLWLRALSLSGAGDDAAAFESRLVTLSGWSTRFSVRYEISKPWSLFAGVQLLTLFSQPALTLESRRASPETPGTGPFFNADGSVAEGMPTSLEAYELPITAPVLLAGVSFAP